MVSESARKSVTLSYGAFAAVLFGVLIVGFLVGSLFGGLTLSSILEASETGGFPAPPSNQAWIGITYLPITTALAHSYNLPVNVGALVVAVSPNSPAQKAGMRDEDIITAVDNSAITEGTNLLDLMLTRKPGDQVKMAVLRQGNPQTLVITLGRSGPAASQIVTPYSN